MMDYKFSTSLMCMDQMNAKEQIGILNKCADFYHIDLIDWHYVKNMCLSPQFIKQLRPLTKVSIDAHIMMEQPDTDLIKVLIDCGIDYITLHSDQIERRTFRLINLIKSHQKKIGIALNPAVPLESIREYIHLIDKITFMAVDPGYSGQQFVPEVLKKIETAAKLKESKGFSYLIEVDGHCNQSTYTDLIRAGTEVYVLGSTGLFGLDPDLTIAWNKMTHYFMKCVLESKNKQQ